MHIRAILSSLHNGKYRTEHLEKIKSKMPRNGKQIPNVALDVNAFCTRKQKKSPVSKKRSPDDFVLKNMLKELVKKARKTHALRIRI